MKHALLAIYLGGAIGFFVGTDAGTRRYHVHDPIAQRILVSACWPMSVGIVAGEYAEQIRAEAQRVKP